jgi:L,D-transpeptidase catalytic domain
LVNSLWPAPQFGYGRKNSQRAALAAGVTVAALLSLSQSAEARSLRYYGWQASYGNYYVRRVRPVSQVRHEGSEAKKEPRKEAGFGEMPKGPLQIVVNVGIQKVTLYSNGQRVAQGPVSTGVPGHPTPFGVFSIIEKDRFHHSNIYSGAPMPFMQRITWSGVAMHEGVVPGHPASHGCIRLTHDFAQKLWPVTKLGVRVLVVHNEVVPADFDHAKLFAPKAKPGEPPIAMIGPTDGQGGSHAIVLAQTEERGAKDVVPLTASEEPQHRINANPETIQAGQSGEGKIGESARVEPIEERNLSKPAAAEKTQEAKPAEPGVSGAELRKSVEVPKEPADSTEVTSSTVSPAPAEASANEESVKPAPTDEPRKPITPRYKSVDQPAKRAGQVAVFVSRKEKKIFVRQGFIPVFEMPITIEEPDRPLGTHVFTAMGAQENGSGMRWNLMSIPTDGSSVEPGVRRGRFREPPRVIPSAKPPSGPAEALNRIQFPKEAIDQISELLIPGSSLVVSDEGLGRETGRATEFIVLTR